MKSLILGVALFFGITYSATAQIESARLKADGLTCSMCSKAIFKALEKLSFVDKIDADVETSVFTITFKKGQTVSPDRIAKAVTDAGFAVGQLELTANLPADAAGGKDAHIAFDGATYHLLNAPEGSVAGEHKLLLADKSFLKAEDRVSYAKMTDMPCFETGKMGACCADHKELGKTKGKASERVYHVVLN
jgi:copper chaperone CopZ